MRDALKILGYKDVHHMEDIFANPLEAGMWTEAINARFFGQGTPYGKAEWDQLLGHCQVRVVRTVGRTLLSALGAGCYRHPGCDVR
jgi:hypothetical protein